MLRAPNRAEHALHRLGVGILKSNDIFIDISVIASSGEIEAGKSCARQRREKLAASGGAKSCFQTAYDKPGFAGVTLALIGGNQA